MVVTGGGPACTTKQSTCTVTLGKSRPKATTPTRGHAIISSFACGAWHPMGQYIACVR